MEARERIERAKVGFSDEREWAIRIAEAAVEAHEKRHDHIVGQYGYLFACLRCEADAALVAAIEPES